jgi:hypothetical protein
MVMKFAISWTLLTHMSSAVWVSPRELFDQLGRRYCFYNFKVFSVYISTLYKMKLLERRQNPWTKRRPYQYRRAEGLTITDVQIGQKKLMVSCVLVAKNLGTQHLQEGITCGDQGATTLEAVEIRAGKRKRQVERVDARARAD